MTSNVNVYNVLASVDKYQTRVNKRKKYLVSAHGLITNNSRPFRVPDNVLIMYLTPYGMTIDSIQQHHGMANWYKQRRGVRLLEYKHFLKRGSGESGFDKPKVIQKAMIAGPGLMTHNVRLSFPDFENTNNLTKWERNEMGIFSLPLRARLGNKNSNGRYTINRFTKAFEYTPPIVTLKDLSLHLSGQGGGILMIDACRALASNSNSPKYCRREGCFDKLPRGAGRCKQQHKKEKSATRMFLGLLKKYGRHNTREGRFKTLENMNSKSSSNSNKSSSTSNSNSNSNSNFGYRPMNPYGLNRSSV